MPTKADWKLFQQRLPEYRERYLQQRTQDFVRMLQDPSKTGTERFWDTHHAIEEEAKELRQMLDGYRKKDMEMRLAWLIRAGVAQHSDLSEYSEALQSDVKKWLNS